MARGEAQAVRIYLPEEPTSEAGSELTHESRQSVIPDYAPDFDADDDDQGEFEPLEPGFLPEAWFDPSRIDLRRPIDGTATLIVSRYLHFYLDIVFLPVEAETTASDELLPGTDPESLRRELTQMLADGQITLEEARARMSTSRSRDFYGFRLDQSRRMRNGEIHFFDHPAFSVIVLIEPREFELPETPAQENSTTALQQLDQ